jgi:hypothetical protein
MIFALRAVTLIGLYGVYSVFTNHSLSFEWVLLMLVVSAIFVVLLLSSFKWRLIGRRIEYHFLQFNEQVWNRFDRRHQRRVR